MQELTRLVPNWTDPICIGRHAFGDQYKAFKVIKGPGKLTMSFESENGDITSWEVYQYTNGGVAMSMYNTDESIYGFAILF